MTDYSHTDTALVRRLYQGAAPGPIVSRMLGLIDRLEDDDDPAALVADLGILADQLDESDELRPYQLIESGGGVYDTILAASAEAAYDVAEANARANQDSYDRSEGTVWIDLIARSVLTDDEARGNVTLDPDEPDCADGYDHEWRSPYSVLGGIEENPGVWGHGGGVLMKSVCRHCGAYRVVDTWASNGARQGLESTRYEDADDASLAWVTSLLYDDVTERLRDLIEVRPAPDDDAIAYTAIEVDGDDDEAAEARLGEIREALGAGYDARWTGAGTGDTMDVRIERA